MTLKVILHIPYAFPEVETARGMWVIEACMQGKYDGKAKPALHAVPSHMLAQQELLPVQLLIDT